MEISASNRIKSTKKEGLSTGAKWALGILGTVVTAYAGLVTHRMINKPTIEKVAKNFSEIFRRDISADEAQKMVKRYEDLINIKDTEEFCKKAFEQVKKDYGYEKLNIPLKFENSGRGAAAGWSSGEGILTLYCKDKLGKDLGNYGRKGLIKDLIHEFQHAKQTEIAYRTSPEKFLQAHRDNITLGKITALLSQPKDKQKLIASSQNMTVSEFRNFLKTIALERDLTELNVRINNKELLEAKIDDITNIKKLFGKMTPFKKGSKEYQQGLDYIKNTAEYINPIIDYSAYRKQLLEAEAHATGDKFNQIYNYFATPWRLF